MAVRTIARLDVKGPNPTQGVDPDPPVIDWRLAATNRLQEIEPLTLERISPFPARRTQRRPVGRFNPAAFEISSQEPRTSFDACLSVAYAMHPAGSQTHNTARLESNTGLGLVEPIRFDAAAPGLEV